MSSPERLLRRAYRNHLFQKYFVMLVSTPHLRSAQVYGVERAPSSTQPANLSFSKVHRWLSSLERSLRRAYRNQQVTRLLSVTGGFDTGGKAPALLNHRIILDFSMVKNLLRKCRKQFWTSIYQSFALTPRPALNLFLSIICIRNVLILFAINQNDG